MFGIGGTELVVIAIVLLVAVGPTRLPGLLKAVVKGYREFRRATRELRASTGIDEILQDEELKDLRKPLYVPPAKTKAIPAKKPGIQKRAIRYADRVREVPPEGVDLAVIREDARRAEEARIRAEKIAAAEAHDGTSEKAAREKEAREEEAPEEAPKKAAGED